MENAKILEALAEIDRPKLDLSDLIAEISILAFELEQFERGLWWDAESNRPRFRHQAIAHWMQVYKFSRFDDLPVAAVVAFRDSLRHRLAGNRAGVQGTLEP